MADGGGDVQQQRSGMGSRERSQLTSREAILAQSGLKGTMAPPPER